MLSRNTRLARIGGALLALLGAGGLAFGVHIGVNGAEPGLPAPDVAVEGFLADGDTVASPVGEPFLYGQVRIADQPGPTAPHHAGDYGDPNVVVIQPDGERVAVRLGPSEEWQMTPLARERIEGVRQLRGLPLIGDVDTEGRLNPPFFIDLRVVRPGDSVVLEVNDGVATRTYVGTRELHARLHREREAMRWPVVALLVVLGTVSLIGGARLSRTRLDDPGDSDARDASADPSHV